jgi:signal transduction histidine kinase/ActR/RegA family two-component response regulator
VTGNSSDEISELRRTNRDLVALSTLPAAWTGYGRQGIVESLADVLLSVLPLEIVYVNLRTGPEGEAIEIVRNKPGRDAAGDREVIRNALGSWLDTDGSTPPPPIPDPSRSGTLRSAAARFGYSGSGFLVAASGQPDFPTERDRLLLGMGANQAAIVMQRNQVEEALRASEQALLESDRRKDEFLAMLAHELRNPLAPILTAARYLEERGPAQPDLEWAREVILRQLRRLTRLVDDLLDVSRIAQGKIELRREPVDVGAVVARAVEMSRDLVERRRHELAVTLPATPPWITADPLRLEQVLANLLNNAAKYTPEGGRIELAVEHQAGEVVFRVRDNGIGIETEMLARVFDPFVQLHRSADRAQGGLGIGLALVRSLVEMHGGRVAACSAGSGRGSEFLVHLPAAGEAAPASVRSALAEESAAPAPPRRILVVDDNADAADSLALLLRLGGHDVQTAYDGPAALAAAAAFRPEVVLLDIGLPRMDGLEVARRLRAEHAPGNMVLVAVTGYGQEEDRRQAGEAGFDHHFTKPLEIDALNALLLDPQAAAPRG